METGEKSDPSRAVSLRKYIMCVCLLQSLYRPMIWLLRQ